MTATIKTSPVTCYHDSGCGEDYTGAIAKKYGVVVGCIGCPGCGVTINGRIPKICGFCGYTLELSEGEHGTNSETSGCEGQD